MSAQSATIAVNRFGLGAQPGELAAAGADARGWLRGQLHAAPLLDAALPNSGSILASADGMRRELRALRQSAAAAANPNTADASANLNANAAPFMRLRQYLRSQYVADALARLQSAAQTPRPFAERLVHFWSNHFAVSVDKLAVLGVAGSFEREAIRPHVLSNFRDLLLAVEQHPAMLLYLDNQQSVGPHSKQAERAATRGRTLGLNENLARETLELHTLGVDAGYTQGDVTNFAKVLTGWSIGLRGPLQPGTPGEFIFRPQLHEPGAQSVFGRRYADDGLAQGVAVLSDLATAPATAQHLATKLVRHFIADDPPAAAAAVTRVARAFERSRGDLPSVYQALIDCPEAWDDTPQKFKTPQDYLFSIYRGLKLPVEGEGALAPFEQLGQRQFAPGSPAGWPDRSADWDGASALMKRIEFSHAVAQRSGDALNAAELAPQLLGASLTEATRSAIERAASAAQGLTLLLVAPEFIRR